MQKARGQAGTSGARAPHGPWPSHCLWADGFRYSFTPLTGVLFTFPSRYWFTIGRRVVFSLGRWSSRIPAGFHVPRGTWVSDQESPLPFRLRDSHPLWRTLPDPSTMGRVGNFPAGPKPGPIGPHDTQRTTPSGFDMRQVWAVSVSLAATTKITVVFYSWGY